MRSIRSQLGTLFFAFFLLVMVSAGLTFWGLRAQADSALIINLAGRQRMLVQQMTRLAFAIGAGEDAWTELSAAATAFESTQAGLENGGQVFYLPEGQVHVPAAQDPATLTQLVRVRELWEAYRESLVRLQSSQPGTAEFAGALAEMERQSPGLVAEADAAVRLFQAKSNRQVEQLRRVQMLFLAGALLLLALGVWILNRSILDPLKRLGQSAGRIGQGDLLTPVAVDGPGEIQLLAGSFDGMRQELAASQAELVKSAERQEERVEQRTRELEALYEVSREISSRLDLDHVLRSVTDKARQLLGADAALLCLLEESQPVLGLQAYSGVDTIIRSVSSPAENPFVAEVLGERGARSCESRVCRGTCGILDDAYRASHLAAPLWLGDQVIGALCVGSRQKGQFSEDSSVLLTRMANTAAVALGNARLYAQAERAAALEERQRIAGQMHDGLAQMVNYLGLVVDQAGEQLEQGQVELARENLARVRRGLDGASAEVRRSIASLQDELPPSKDLQQLLSELVQEFARGEQGQVEWISDLEGSLRLTFDETQQVLGVAQEALQNARLYSGASRVYLRLASNGRQTALTVEDDGRGFDPGTSPEDGRRHFGLAILRARAARLEGTLEVRSSPGAGTCVTLTWPARRAPAPVRGV